MVCIVHRGEEILLNLSIRKGYSRGLEGSGKQIEEHCCCSSNHSCESPSVGWSSIEKCVEVAPLKGVFLCGCGSRGKGEVAKAIWIQCRRGASLPSLGGMIFW